MLVTKHYLRKKLAEVSNSLSVQRSPSSSVISYLHGQKTVYEELLRLPSKGIRDLYTRIIKIFRP